MKKCWILVCVLALMLSGCGVQETFETVADVYVQGEAVQMRQVLLELPEGAAAAVMRGDGGDALYFCDGYTVAVQTFASGDLEKTLLEITGYAKDSLKPVGTLQGDAKRYDCVWSAAGETGDQVGRAAVLDDGNYHYTVAVMADAAEAGNLTAQWQTLLDSFGLAPVSTDS